VKLVSRWETCEQMGNLGVDGKLVSRWETCEQMGNLGVDGKLVSSETC
jgi:hypothetical protein